MFDATKADPRKQAIYNALSAQDKILVDQGYLDIESFAGVLNTQAAPKKVAPSAVPLPATSDSGGDIFSALNPTLAVLDRLTGKDYNRAVGKAVGGTVVQAIGQLGRLPEESMIAGLGLDQYTQDLLRKTPMFAGAPIIEAKGKELLQESEADRKKLGIGHGFEGGPKGWALDIAQSPDNAAGLVGGLVSKTGVGAPIGQALIGIPTARVGLNKYFELRDSGVPQDEALARAGAEAGIEYATENLSFGKAAGLGKEMVTSTFSKILKSAGVEGGEEILANLGQRGVDNFIAELGLGSEKLQSKAEQSKFKSAEDLVKDSMYAGFLGSIMGGGIRSATAPFETQQEIRGFEERAADMLKRGRAASEIQHEIADKGMEAIFTPSMAKTEQTPEKAAQEDLAYKQNEERKQAIRDEGFKAAEAEKLADTSPIAKALVKAGIGTGDTVPVSGTLKAPAMKAPATRLESKPEVVEVVEKDNSPEAKAARRKEYQRLGRAKKIHKEARAAAEKQGVDLAAWDISNPIPTKETLAPEQEKKVSDKDSLLKGMEDIARVTKGNAEVAANASPRKPVPVRGSKVNNPTKDLKVTMRNQTKDMQPREMNALEAGIESGKIQVVPSSHKIDGKELGEADGVYNGDTLYVNQDSLDSGRRIMDVASHEVDHYYKHSGKLEAGDVRKVFAGKGDVDSLVSRIEKLAATKNAVALKAQAAAKRASESNPEIYKDEIVSYFHQYAKEASRKGMLATARSTFNDIVSSLKGSRLDELTDSTYISNKRLENLKHATPKEGSVKTRLESFLGKKGKDFEKAKAAGRTIVGTDGKERYWVTDKFSMFKQRNWENVPLSSKSGTSPKGTFTLKDIIHHPLLFDQLPILEDIPVYKYSADDDTAGFMRAGTRYWDAPAAIWLNARYIKDNSKANPENNLLTVLHENQHVIQEMEDFAGGASPDAIASNIKNRVLYDIMTIFHVNPASADKIFDRVAYDAGYNDYNDLLNSYQDEDSLSSTMADKKKTEEFVDRVESYRSAKSEAEGRRVLASLLESGVINQFNSPDIADEITDYREADVKAMQQYRDHSGERESRMVEHFKAELPQTQYTSPETYYKGYVQKPGEIVSTKSFSSASFRQKGEGEIDPTAYDVWAEMLIGGRRNLQKTIEDEEYAKKIGENPEAFESVYRYNWAKKATKRYLDKYAGTLEDPLKDVVLHAGLRWEEYMDAYTTSKIKDSKRIFNPSENIDIEDYLSHVGDYLATIPIDKLNQYDLVRAVLETKRADEEAARKAAKIKDETIAKANKNVTVVREYEDGTKWVKLDKPGQFAAESDIMGHSVRGYEPPKEITEWVPHPGRRETKADGTIINRVGNLKSQHPDWIPESGDSGSPYYGHGGWDAIKSGKAQIYSLRDKTGHSHVTIEVYNGKKWEGDNDEIDSEEAYKQISQIKGKGNAHPVDRYIPFIQDFVLNLGPWQDIGDIYNANLKKVDDRIMTYQQIQYADKHDVSWEKAIEANPPQVPAIKQTTRLESRSQEEEDSSEAESLLNSLLDLPGVRTVAGLFTTAKGGRVFREMKEAATGFTSEYSIVAEANFNDFTDALKEAEEINPRFDWVVFWDKVEEEKDNDQRDRIIGAMAREFPEVARSYRMFRDSVDNLTDMIVLERLSRIDTQPFDDKTEEGKKEIALYKALVDNKGRYTTRSYLIAKGKEGKLFGKLSWKAYKSALAAVEKGEDIDPQVEKAAARVANAMAYYQRVLNIPEELPTNESNLRELFTAWFPNSEGTSKKVMKEMLNKRRLTLTKTQVNANAEEIIKEILGVTPERAGYLASRLRGSQRDNTIMMAREDVPKVIRELMGEVKENLPLKFLLTLNAQANYVARTRFLSEVAEDPNLAVSADNRFDPKYKAFTQRLSGPSWGPLDGMYVTPWIEDMLADQKTIPGSAYDAVRLIGSGKAKDGSAALIAWMANKWGNISGVAKGLKIIGSPMGYIFNVGGNVFNLMRSGFNINPKYSMRAFNVARQLVGSKSLRDVSEDTRKMNRMGVLDSAQVGELMIETLDIIQDEVFAQTRPANLKDKARKTLRSVGGTLKEVYAMTDVVSKISNTMQMLDQYREFYKANGDDISEEKLERIVADRIKDENVTFSRAMPALKAVESKGLTWFATYIGETFRTQIFNLANIKKEIDMVRNAKTPEAKVKGTEIVIRHMAGTMVAWGMVTALLNAIAGGGDDEKDKGWKRFLPEWARIGSPVNLGTNAEGHPLMFTLSRFDPVGPVMDLFRAGASGEIKDIDDVQKAFVDLYVKPTVGKAVWDYIAAENNEKASQAAERVGKAFLPGIVQNYMNTTSPVQDDWKGTLGKTVRLVGGRLEEANPSKAMRNSYMEYRKILDNGRRDLYGSLSRGDTDQFISRLQEYIPQEQKAFRDMVELDRAMVAINYTPRQRRTIMDKAGLSNIVAEQVIKGHNPDVSISNLISIRSIKASLESSAKRETREDFQKILSNARKARVQLERLGYKFKE